MLNGFLTVKEAAEKLGLSGQQIRNICIKGQFPGAQKEGATWFIPEESVSSYKPGPQGFAAVWKKIRDKEAALEAEKAAMKETKKEETE